MSDPNTGADPAEKSSHYEVVVVGAGPAGISAAINLANRKKSVVVMDGQRPFSYTRKAPKVPNYPGFTFTSGEGLASAFIEHLERFNVPLLREKVSKIYREDDRLVLFTDKDMYEAKVVILANGLYREPDLEGEDELVGRGVAYCVSCDGRLFAGKDLAFISYLEEGEEEATVLAQDFASSLVYLPLYGGPYHLPAGVRVLARKRPGRLFRDESGKVHVLHPDEEVVVDGVFVYRRSVAPHDLLEGLEVEGGHIVVDASLQTSVPGVLAAGDATGEPYQIAKAVGQGQIAAFQALQLLRPAVRGTASSGTAERTAASGGRAAPQALADEDKKELSALFEEKLAGPVRLVHLTQLAGTGRSLPTEACREARQLVEDLASLSAKLELDVHDMLTEKELAEELGVERIPATLAARPGEAARLRFFGVPEGYEFGPLVDALVDLSAEAPGEVSDETRSALSRLRVPVRLEVLTTSTCPVCPGVVRLAHQFSLASPKITVDMVAASDFPELVQRYQVGQVPLVVVDGVPAEPGRVDESRLLELILASAAGRDTSRRRDGVSRRSPAKGGSSSP